MIIRSIRIALLFSLSLLLLSCATTQPKSTENACSIFREKDDWFEASKEVEEKYGLPMQVQLAIMRQESSFRHDAKPPRETILGIPMWWRKSSAYGYAQVKDETWDWYISKTGNRWADRDDYEDAVDFMGWYCTISNKRLGISKWDTFNLYLAYHEGHGGWERQTYLKKPWLIEVAHKVDRYAREYGAQLQQCRSSMGSKSWWRRF